MSIGYTATRTIIVPSMDLRPQQLTETLASVRLLGSCSFQSSLLLPEQLPQSTSPAPKNLRAKTTPLRGADFHQNHLSSERRCAAPLKRPESIFAVPSSGWCLGPSRRARGASRRPERGSLRDEFSWTATGPGPLLAAAVARPCPATTTEHSTKLSAGCRWADVGRPPRSVREAHHLPGLRDLHQNAKPSEPSRAAAEMLIEYACSAEKRQGQHSATASRLGQSWQGALRPVFPPKTSSVCLQVPREHHRVGTSSAWHVPGAGHGFPAISLGELRSTSGTAPSPSHRPGSHKHTGR